MSKIELITDHSNQQLQEVPQNVLQMCNLRMLYLEKNSIEYLPEDFFLRLPRLTWLDLRQNRLKVIPRSIGYSECLENLLLANNQIERLPTELGLVPTLKNLLISGNPLTYPSEYILDKGTEAISEYLRKEHLKLHPIERSKSAEIQTIKPEKPPTKRPKSANVRDLLRAASRSAMTKPPNDTPVMTITSLSPAKEEDVQKQERKPASPMKRSHRVTKCCSKITVRSNINSVRYLGGLKSMKTQNDVEEAELQQMWLKKLKDLLDEQNKILQQEKNLKALSLWRFNKKTEPARTATPLRTRKRLKTPYGTDPAYDIMLSRRELSEQIDRVIKDTGRPMEKVVDIEKLIAEVVTQLKGLETSCMEVQSPRSEIENAGKQIQTILELHKKIANAKVINDKS